MLLAAFLLILPSPSTTQKTELTCRRRATQHLFSQTAWLLLITKLEQTDFPFVTIIYKTWKKERFHKVTWLLQLVFFFFFWYEMDIGCYFYRLKCCSKSLKRKGVLFSYFVRNAFPMCFWEGVWGTLQSFCLTTTVQFRKILEQMLNCKHT